jgi:hypothetical protein
MQSPVHVGGSSLPPPPKGACAMVASAILGLGQ